LEGLNGALDYDFGGVVAAHGINRHTNSHEISTLGCAAALTWDEASESPLR
jgi:hypothetical protein